MDRRRRGRSVATIPDPVAHRTRPSRSAGDAGAEACGTGRGTAGPFAGRIDVLLHRNAATGTAHDAGVPKERFFSAIFRENGISFRNIKSGITKP